MAQKSWKTPSSSRVSAPRARNTPDDADASPHAGSLTEQTADWLRGMLLAGELGEPLPPERQLSDLFDVSRITLRRAMAQLEEEGVIRREQGRGTFACDGPAMTSVAELTSLTEPVVAVLVRQDGVWFNPQLTPWTWRICRAMSRHLEQTGTRLCLVNDDKFLAALSRGRLTPKQVRGFLAPSHVWNGERYEMALAGGLPWIGLSRTSRSMFWNILDPDWTAALAEGIADLRPTPRDRVFIPAVKHPQEVDQQGWHETAMIELDRHGVPADRIVVEAEGLYESQGYLATREYLRRHGEPTIVLAPFDLCIVGAYRALRTHNRSGLARIRFLGNANLQIGHYLTPALSTLSMDYDRMARRILDGFAIQHRTGRPQSLQHESAVYIRRDSSGATDE